MVSGSESRAAGPVTIAPWLTVPDGARAVEFYTSAFGAVETYRFEEAPAPAWWHGCRSRAHRSG